MWPANKDGRQPNNDDAMNPQHDTSTTDWRRYAVLGAVGTTFAGSLLLISPFVFMQLKSPLPYMSTPRRKILKALYFVSNSRQTRKRNEPSSSKESVLPVRQGNFYDLGSGDGEAVLAAASAGWNATGIEMNPTLWAVSQLRRIFSPSHVRTKSRFILGDMFKHSIRSADVVMIFGVKPLMPRIADKIAGECSAETCVMSYRFRIPIQEGDIDDQVAGDDSKLNARMIFDDEEMRVWEIVQKKSGANDKNVSRWTT